MIEKTQFPPQFICELSNNLIEQVYTALRVYGVPDEARKALDAAVFLQIIVDTMVPPEYIPDDAEIEDAVKRAGRLYVDLHRANAARVRKLDEKEWAALCAPHLAGL